MESNYLNDNISVLSDFEDEYIDDSITDHLDHYVLLGSDYDTTDNVRPIKPGQIYVASNGFEHYLYQP